MPRMVNSRPGQSSTEDCVERGDPDMSAELDALRQEERSSEIVDERDDQSPPWPPEVSKQRKVQGKSNLPVASGSQARTKREVTADALLLAGKELFGPFALPSGDPYFPLADGPTQTAVKQARINKLLLDPRIGVLDPAKACRPCRLRSYPCLVRLSFVKRKHCLCCDSNKKICTWANNDNFTPEVESIAGEEGLEEVEDDVECVKWFLDSLKYIEEEEVRLKQEMRSLEGQSGAASPGGTVERGMTVYPDQENVNVTTEADCKAAELSQAIQAWDEMRNDMVSWLRRFRQAITVKQVHAG